MDPNSILVRHRKFLKSLEQKKQEERDANDQIIEIQKQKTEKFKKNAAKQREKIRGLKDDDINNQPQVNEQHYEPLQEQQQDLNTMPAALTEENLKKSQKQYSETASQKSKAKKGGKAKPAWATTEA